MAFATKFSMIGMAAPLVLYAQINVTGVSTTTTQAILQYISPVSGACSLQVADMQRAIAITSGGQASGQVTIQTAAPHGLLAGSVIYIENSGVTAWNGWQVLTSVPASTSFTFVNAGAGAATQGNVGVLVDDVNPALFPGADRDSRPGNVTTGQMQLNGQTQVLAPTSGRSRSFVVGLRYAQFASDGNRYSRALQANTRHHFTLTCGTQSFDQEFQTQNIPLGDTHNDGPLADRNYPGQYAYPTIQWSNQQQALIDPVSGLRSFRGTGPSGTPSLTQNFVTAIDSQSIWQNPTAPLTSTGGAAMFTGPCPSGTCPLFLRADNLSIPGGPSYASVGNSLDWVAVTVSQASISNAACAGDDCMIVACLTVNGVTCASANLQASLTTTPANYTFGSKNLMDLWQGSGAPGFSRVEASQTSGTVNYTAATQQASLAGGSPFSTRWTAGSTINIAGAQYTIASVQSERQLTLVSGPNSNLGGVPYSANNFGVLLWKKTATADRVSIGYTTYLYGSTPNTDWTAAATNPCSPPVSVGGVQGYNCFIDQELYWLAADGSDVRDLGLVEFSYEPSGNFGSGGTCGSSSATYQFDPQNGDSWYCIVNLQFDSARVTLVQAHYNGGHTRNTPGKLLPDCSLNKGVQPCLQFTVMQPNKNQSISQVAPGFNPDYAASGFQETNGYWYITGVSPDGDVGFSIAGPSQDTPGWMFVFTLGDRTPAGTDANSVSLVAGMSTYRHPPLSWCTIHDVIAPDSGWMEIFSNDLSFQGASGTYTMTLTSAPLNQTVGAPGGLNACPPNVFGVTGQMCTAITVSGPPTRATDGSVLQNAQVGDLMYLDSEEVRIVALTSPTQMTIQRAYVYQIATHTNTKFIMGCGTRNIQGSAVGLWNYRSDPYGTNVNWNTVIPDPAILGGHTFLGGGIPSPVATAVSGGATYNLGVLCPQSSSGGCDQVRLGYMSTALQSPVYAVSLDPPFAGHVGIGVPNEVDTHPGPCFSGWCMDARAMDGGPGGTLGASQPFTQVTGQLWKVSGAQSLLNRKFLSTMAYAGRSSLLDVSGPASLLSGGAQDSYKYCYALIAGECQPGSAAGDVYVNTPYVSYPYCYYPGIANQDDDTNAICIGDLGAYTGNLAQLGYMQQDVVGAGTRRLGPNYSRWNQQDAYWNSNVTPSGLLMATRVRWLDGVRNDDLMTILPPYPASDGVARFTFLPVPVAIDPPAGLPAQSVIVEFGYAENGSPESYYCTSRQETCVAASGGINQTAPFYFEQSETYSGVPCATGCTVTVPALSQRVLYYRWKYLSGSGQVVSSSQVHVVVTP
jgi:hypothetical protein